MKIPKFDIQVIQAQDGWKAFLNEYPEFTVTSRTEDIARNEMQTFLNRISGIIIQKLIEQKEHEKEWDIFISYASEDREEVAQPLYNHLTSLNKQIWFDQSEIKLGESWVRKIQEGLINSEYGLFIISPNFMQKHWTNKELSTFQSLVVSNEERILPILHNLHREDLKQYPFLYDLQNSTTDIDFDKIVQQIMQRIDPDNRYYSDEKHGLVITPASLKLGRGDWKIDEGNSLYIQNLTNEPLYAIEIVMTLHSKDLTFGDLQIIGLGNFVLSFADGRQQTQINRLPPFANHEISIKTLKASVDRESRVEFEVGSFKTEPSPILYQ